MFKRLVLTAALATASAAAFAAPVTYKIDPNHTAVIASWSHFGFSNPSRELQPGRRRDRVRRRTTSASRSVNVTLPLAGLDANVEAFNEHLRSADFFDAEKYPTITFKSTKVEAAGDNKLRVFGDLTLHGVTKPVVLDTTINKLGDHPMSKRATAGFAATTTIKRSDFGVDKYAPNVSDEVLISITTEAMVPKPGADKQPADKK